MSSLSKQLTVRNQLAKRIIFLRKQKGLSQLALAYDAEINRNYLSDLENGRRNPSLDVLERISNALGISLSELFKGIETIPGL